ncbi:hypothetical protein LR48_Vigan09g054500 [Vigna angularis]|uniref:Uncharacterized protein n=1 Tax=Phaseolus angularis TaxID=3914 RepID=A0A0L9V9X8_PHAAN|nr:hypothetical protein LR48_Vigan09g054500 [Vigna angularis]
MTATTTPSANFGGVVTSVPGDENQSHVFTAPPTFPSSYVPTLASEETAEHFEDQADMSNTLDSGRPPSSSRTLSIFKEVEVSIPQIDYSVDCVDDCLDGEFSGRKHHAEDGLHSSSSFEAVTIRPAEGKSAPRLPHLEVVVTYNQEKRDGD